MAANYRVFTIDAGPADNIVDKIYEQLQKEGYSNPDFKLHFVGFEAEKGTQFKLNQNNMVVPTNGYFISPYEEYYNGQVIGAIYYNLINYYGIKLLC